MLTFIRLFTPRTIRLLNVLVGVWGRRQLIWFFASNGWLAWRTYRQVQAELNKPVDWEAQLDELPDLTAGL